MSLAKVVIYTSSLLCLREGSVTAEVTVARIGSCQPSCVDHRRACRQLLGGQTAHASAVRSRTSPHTDVTIMAIQQDTWRL